MTEPITIGVTGGIGSGKTTVCSVLECLGVPVYQADYEAKQLMLNDTFLINQIKNAFGQESYLSNKELNRTYLAKQVFSDSEQLKLLNSLVHPVVKKSFQKWCDKNKAYSILAKEAALLYESGSYIDLNRIILVTAPQELRVTRILARDKHRNREDILSIINNQLSDDDKASQADYVLCNDEKQLIVPQVSQIIESIKKAIV